MSETDKILNHLGASSSNRNVGTKVKMEILRAVIDNCIGKKDIPIPTLVSILSLRCNVTPRTMKEGYVEPLIDVGILKSVGNNCVSYIGIVEIETPKKELTKAEKEKIQEEALRK